MSRNPELTPIHPANEQVPTQRARPFSNGHQDAEALLSPTHAVEQGLSHIALIRLPEGHLIGDYEILEELARGGMGVVYKARQISLGRTVALKMVLRGPASLPTDVQRFRSEALAIARLTHPNLVQIFEVGEQTGLPYFTMEYLAGGTLSRRLAGQPMPPRQAAQLVLTLARAIHYAHQNDILHRDLKPSNVLLDEEGTPKITDFGITKRLDEKDSLSLTGEVLGTPGYMAPEQAAAQPNIGPTADVYGLGSILYEALTGRAPFSGPDPAAVLLQIVSNDPISPRILAPGTPRDLETICLKCLEKSPTSRYQSAEELAADCCSIASMPQPPPLTLLDTLAEKGVISAEFATGKERWFSLNSLARSSNTTYASN